jgi:hypothetical protein
MYHISYVAWTADNLRFYWISKLPLGYCSILQKTYMWCMKISVETINLGGDSGTRRDMQTCPLIKLTEWIQISKNLIFWLVLIRHLESRTKGRTGRMMPRQMPYKWTWNRCGCYQISFIYQLMNSWIVLKRAWFRTMQHKYTNKDLIIYAATSSRN